jgi:hypothetical protein
MDADERGSEPAGLSLMHTEGTDPNAEEQGLPRIDADERGSEPAGLPLIHTENTDLKSGEQTLPRMNTDETDKDGELGKILPQSVGVLEGFAGLDRSTPGCAAGSR